MAKKNQIQFDTSAFSDLSNRFEALQEEIDECAEIVLKRSHDFMLPKLEEGTEKSKLPAKGKYSKGNLKKSILRDKTVSKNGVILELPFGFDKKQVTYSNYLIKGTPRMKKASAIWNVFYGAKSKKELANFQHNVMWSYFSFKKDQRK